MAIEFNRLNMGDHSQPLCPAFNVATLHIAGRINPRGWGVSDKAPDTLDKLRACVKRDGRLTVWNGASERTVYADREINYAARAWHDARHYTLGAEFTYAGERRVLDAQIADVRKLFGRGSIGDTFASLLAIEVAGQLEHEAETGEFPTDQRGFAEAILRRTRGLFAVVSPEGALQGARWVIREQGAF